MIKIGPASTFPLDNERNVRFAANERHTTGVEDDMVDRRDFAKRAAVATGLVWAAPAVVATSSASAQQPGSPQPFDCTGQGTALVAMGTVLGIPVSVGPIAQSSDGFVEVASLGPDPLLGLSATVLRGGFTPCTAEASVATLALGLPLLPVITAGVLTSSATGGSDCAAVGSSSSVANLTFGGTEIFDGSGPATLTPIPGVTITVNEQMCTDTEISATALRISVNLPGLLPGPADDIVLEVIVAESRASKDANCPCP
jgi:hypothetical protein